MAFIECDIGRTNNAVPFIPAQMTGGKMVEDRVLPRLF